MRNTPHTEACHETKIRLSGVHIPDWSVRTHRKNADFYPFLAFILFFQYLFVQPDEMFVENMRKAAAWAFYANLTAATIVTICHAALRDGTLHSALAAGMGAGFGLALMIFAFATVWF